MSVEWFDLAQRLYAAETGRPVARLAHTTFTPSACERTRRQRERVRCGVRWRRGNRV